MNRMGSEASPYLRQHANSPVDWYPWGPEALDRARAEDKPILLSIGYSTCHFCHVMERESFQNPAIARVLNESFVCIKVDREERPDVDAIYQSAMRMMGHAGGWPLTMFLTPNQRPFFGGNYIPPADRFDQPGILHVVDTVTRAYKTKRAEVDQQARDLAQAIEQAGDFELRAVAPAAVGRDALAKAAKKLLAKFDDRFGGFGSRPKFPNPVLLDLLLRYAVQERDPAAKRRAALSLDAMRRGGIWDHLGGGFHRYSTDERWLVPHFEKMLSDNALLLRLYCDAFRVFGDERYAATASDIGTYLLGEMQSAQGGFFSAQDADSEGEEGSFFVWTEHEVTELLARDSLAREVALRHFGITRAGNFGTRGATVLSEATPPRLVAEELERPLTEVNAALTRAVLRMLAAREKRSRPFLDEKIITGANGLTIGALADASACLREPALLSAAEKAWEHVERTLVRDGRVQRMLSAGIVKGPGLLDDHAYLCAGLLDLYEVGGDERKAFAARAIADQIIIRFWDPENRTFYLTPNDGEKLLVRSQDSWDRSVPSGASMASSALLKLGAMVDERYSEIARQYLERVAPAAIANPFEHGHTVACVDRLVRGSTDVVILGERRDPSTRRLFHKAFSVYLPNRNVALVDPERSDSAQAAPLLMDGKRPAERATAWVCAGRTCKPPVESPEEFERALSEPVVPD
jgi:uncharacterized protein YyaL (SSP411 family)